MLARQTRVTFMRKQDITFLIAIVLAGLAVLCVCYKAGAPADERIHPYGDSGLSLMQVAESMRGRGLPVTAIRQDLENADRFTATGGVEMAMACLGHEKPFRVYRLADEASYRRTIDYVSGIEESHRREIPGFRFSFLFHRNLLLIYDEIPPSCAEALVGAFSEL